MTDSMTLALGHKTKNLRQSYQKVADLYGVSESSFYCSHTGVDVRVPCDLSLSTRSLSCRRRNWSIRSIYNKYHYWSACLKIYADQQMADDSCERPAYCYILYF